MLKTPDLTEADIRAIVQAVLRVDRRQFRVRITCPDCDTPGAVVWEENSHARDGGFRRLLVAVEGGFHPETGRTQSGDPLIICNVCDTIQKD
jgi:hypothetical protein